jgi:carbon-monoxide dehydrogenase medium subunit
MGSYAYVAPNSVAEAVAVLVENAEQNRRAQVLAGGTDLLVQMRTTDRDPRTIVDIKSLEETNRLEIGETDTFIGSAISSAVLNDTADLVALFPGLLEASDLIGSTQIQGRATMGGNLCNASPAGDSIPAMIANRATCVIAGPKGERSMPVEDFLTGVGTNALESGEFLLGIRVPNPGPRTADAYLRFLPRTADASVSIGAVAPTALLVSAAGDALVGSPVDDAALKAAGAACSEASSPISDKRGTADYRRKVVAVLCRRAAAIARDRALA